MQQFNDHMTHILYDSITYYIRNIAEKRRYDVAENSCDYLSVEAFQIEIKKRGERKQMALEHTTQVK